MRKDKQAGHRLREHGPHRHEANFTRGRKFSSDDLQLMLLALLEKQPSHGYELVKELDSRSGGYWKPSPGMVYPALTYIQEIGYASVSVSSNKKSYALLPEGLAFLNEHRDQAEELLAMLVHLANKMKYIQGAMAADSDATGNDGWLPEFLAARLALKRALLLKSAADPQEQKRITSILQEAIAQINQPCTPPR
ncbi:MAG: PadR family transcriptional regulator [Advenella sp.]